AAGIVHRDIKPENVMLRPDGYVKVLDFGLAKLTEAFDSEDNVDPEATTKPLRDTSPGVIMGTVSYMSPEQSRGQKVDSRSDIFSLGVVLYEMVTGRKPFAGDTMSDVLAQILEREPEPITIYFPNAPGELQWIISKALAKDRDSRYQTVKELLNDLKRLKQHLEFRAEQNRQERTAPMDEHNGIRNSSGRKSGRYLKHISYDTEVIEAPRTTSSAEYLISEIKRNKAGVGLAFATLLLLVAVAGYFWLKPKARLTDSIAVLPFARINADATVDGLLDGVTQGGEQLSINVELVDAKDNSYIWGQKYTRKPSELSALQEEITREVSQRLQLDLNAAEQAEREAYQLYLRGRNYWGRRTVQDLRQGVEAFEQAIKRAPNYAPAYAGLADSYNMLGAYGAMSSAEASAKATEAAERAVALNDSLAEAHNSLAFVKHRYQWDWVGAEREFKRALELDPNYATTHQWYSSFLVSVGRFQEGMEEARHSQELAPLSLIANTHLALMLYYAREYDQVLEQCRKALKLDPNFFGALRYTGLAYEQLRRYNESIEALTKARNQSGNSPVILAALAHAYAAGGNTEEAQRLLDEMAANKTRKIPAFDLAVAYAGLGDKE
ncbi:MAG TPA: protein kinase, partial [Blastocatellia bacterium]|nr:protein kinase [Blastocatellia bacterium]